MGNMRRRLNSANNVVDILEAFAFVSPTWTVSTLARRLGLSKASTYTLLANLESRKLIEKDDETSVYRFGIRFWEIGLKVAASNRLSIVCDPWLKKLRDQGAESCYLAIYDRGEVLYVGKAESENPIQAYTTLGARAPCYCTASGKVLLGALEDAEVKRVLMGPFTAFSATTITNSNEAWKAIKKARKQGFALSSGEWRAEVQSVAVPLIIHNQTPAAICITGPAYRFKTTRALALVRDLKRAASEIQATLGMMATEARSSKRVAITRRPAVAGHLLNQASPSKNRNLAMDHRR